jgi:aldehyde dehydrogenase (NAD+)
MTSTPTAKMPTSAGVSSAPVAPPTPEEILSVLGLHDDPRVSTSEGPNTVATLNPATGTPIAHIALDDRAAYEAAAVRVTEAFKKWRLVPGPVRGQIVREIGNALREHKTHLGALVSLEVGKIFQEGLGEVQETIDIADFAVGLSRQLHGITMPSERPGHRMYEQWLPMGPVGVITAFNFPNAVWGWNAMLAAVCGDSVLWKPSLMAPLTAIATNAIASKVASAHGHPDLFGLVIGEDDEVGETMIRDRRMPLISATGSCRMGRYVGSVVAERLGKSLLELGGNNAAILEADADLDFAMRGIVFGAVGTCGQRCTSTRRLIVQKSIVDDVCQRLVKAYGSIRIGDPLDANTLVGPLINEQSGEAFDRAIALAKEQGGEVLCGGERYSNEQLPEHLRGGTYVQPTVIRVTHGTQLPVAMDETFAPILYVFSYDTLDDAIAMNNAVDQGLSSAIFASDARSLDRFFSPSGDGSDCGLAYGNLGTSGAEIGGAFGGEKDTGGGRESGSDSWKAYMRRQTCSVNFSGQFELAQGIRFE